MDKNIEYRVSTNTKGEDKDIEINIFLPIMLAPKHTSYSHKLEDVVEYTYYTDNEDDVEDILNDFKTQFMSIYKVDPVFIKKY